jgi:long-chain acyl-CoA synthetase
VNLIEALHATAARHGARPAVTDVPSGRSLTYGQLAREADRVAAFLTSQGVTAGQRIGLIAPNDLAYLPAAFGLLATGACLTPLASHLTPSEAAEIMREVELHGWLAAPGADLLSDEKSAALVPGGACDGFALHWGDRDQPGPPGFAALNPAFIRFTSGTTASSKGVVISHEATLARVAAADAVLGFGPEDRVLWVLPLAYHFAVTIVAYVRAAAHILMSPDTLPAAMVETIRRFTPSVLYAAPIHFERMANLESTAPLAGVRVALSTSAPLGPGVAERFEERYGVPVGQAYGIIEAGLPCINLGRGDLPATSVGRPVPGYEVAVRAEDGTPSPAGTAGEIFVRGSGLFSAYYAPWRRFDDVAMRGWFPTGDIGWLDQTGALTLKGRKTSVIFMAGLKFFPEEVEACINRFPGVAESRVFGRPHDRLGEVPCAQIVPAASGCDLAALQAHCARMLSPYKVPVEFATVESVPKTPGGKILRRPMRGADA